MCDHLSFATSSVADFGDWDATSGSSAMDVDVGPLGDDEPAESAAWEGEPEEQLSIEVDAANVAGPSADESKSAAAPGGKSEPKKSKIQSTLFGFFTGKGKGKGRSEDVQPKEPAPRYLPSNYHTSHMLATLGRNPRLLSGSISMVELGLSSLSHLQIRVRFPGGAQSSPRPHTPEAGGSSNPPDSPAKNTCSHTKNKQHADSDDDSDTPILVSPKKKRKDEDQKKKSDVAVWDQTDDEIIAESRKKWKSTAYDHYTINLKRVPSGKYQDQPGTICFVFTCRHDPINHKPLQRARMQDSQGTSNLTKGIKQCEAKCGVSGDSNKNAQQDRSIRVIRLRREI
ncbi:hypothetical protein B0H10DRAFT_1957460 [Mycena sp. CBHHK59/15]|nr:hypothetical protein B0H10DRAFT_1957460 [Mycena sp. CBHHK59/15]